MAIFYAIAVMLASISSVTYADTMTKIPAGSQVVFAADFTIPGQANEVYLGATEDRQHNFRPCWLATATPSNQPRVIRSGRSFFVTSVINIYGDNFKIYQGVNLANALDSDVEIQVYCSTGVSNQISIEEFQSILVDLLHANLILVKPGDL